MPLRLSAFLSLLSLFFIFPVSPARGDDTAILTIRLNEEEKGDFYIIIADDGDFYVRIEDLKEIGFLDPQGTVYEIDNDLYFPLSSMRGVEFHLDEVNITLVMKALPFHFRKQVIDLDRRRTETVLYTRDPSAFLNYGLKYNKEDASFRRIELTNQLGARRGDFLFLTDSIYSDSDEDSRMVRLLTNLTYDRRADLQRLILGDFIVPAGNLTSTLNMGGIRFQKAYLIAPYLITHPLMNLSGSVTLPSELEIYMDGRLFYSESLSPGEFDIRNIFPREGASFMEIVIRDPFGREERLLNSFYLTTALLKGGFHDYGYNMGFLREEFGDKSFQYGDLAYSMSHFYGINDYHTIGFSAEGVKHRYNLGPSGTIRLWNAGILGLALAANQNEDREKGQAGTVKYSYQSRKFNALWAVRSFSRHYSTISTTASPKSTKFQAIAGFGYNTEAFGSFGLGYDFLTRHDGSDQRIISARHSKSIFYHLRVLSLFRKINDSENINEFFINLVYSLARRTTVSASYNRKDDATTETVQIQRNPPFGEGFGGRALYDRSDSDTESTNTFDTFLQYNAPYGTYIGRHRSVGGDQRYELSAAGAVTYVGRTVSVGRPVTDSFALVEVGDLSDVRVYVNNNEIGRTNASGKVFIPNLSSYYENQVSIDNQDIPIDYSFPDVKLFVSPPARSGSHIKFEVSKFKAIFGRIYVQTEGEPELLKLYELSMNVDGEDVVFQTTSHGEFYVEDIGAGRYDASFLYNEKSCSFQIIVPETKDSLIDLEDLVCEDFE